jgi:hypothetical protein
LRGGGRRRARSRSRRGAIGVPIALSEAAEIYVALHRVAVNIAGHRDDQVLVLQLDRVFEFDLFAFDLAFERRFAALVLDFPGQLLAILL